MMMQILLTLMKLFRFSTGFQNINLEFKYYLIPFMFTKLEY